MATRREMLLRGSLIAAVTASLGLFAAGGDLPEAPVAAQTPPPAQRAAAKSESVRIDLLRREAQPRPERDAFAAHSWQPPPPPPPRPKLIAPAPELAEPPPPAAPPLPFTFLGAFEATGGKRVLYIVEGDKVHAVSEGEIVNELYQVEAVGADEMVFTYLPLKLKQTLSLGNPK